QNFRNDKRPRLLALTGNFQRQARPLVVTDRHGISIAAPLHCGCHALVKTNIFSRLGSTFPRQANNSEWESAKQKGQPVPEGHYFGKVNCVAFVAGSARFRKPLCGTLAWRPMLARPCPADCAWAARFPFGPST